MNEPESKPTSVRVTDHRRFDPEGNPRPDGSDEVTGSPEAESVEATAAAEQEPELPAEASAEPPPPSSVQEVNALELELAKTRKRVDELARAYQELSQDREAFERRLSREREQLIRVEKGNVALTLLEAVDELDLCLAASQEDTSPLAQGVRLIRENMLGKLSALGVERFDPVGQTFDPNLAEAADMEITSEASEDQKVVAELRAGYRLEGRVIRAARVKVAKYVRPAQA